MANTTAIALETLINDRNVNAIAQHFKSMTDNRDAVIAALGYGVQLADEGILENVQSSLGLLAPIVSNLGWVVGGLATWQKDAAIAHTLSNQMTILDCVWVSLEFVRSNYDNNSIWVSKILNAMLKEKK